MTAIPILSSSWLAAGHDMDLPTWRSRLAARAACLACHLCHQRFPARQSTAAGLAGKRWVT